MMQTDECAQGSVRLDLNRSATKREV